jgi:putative ribosome biogenesis GTPase RsgA
MKTDVVIAVMGLTGVGKSSFIKNVTGREDITIGHSLISRECNVAYALGAYIS